MVYLFKMIAAVILAFSCLDAYTSSPEEQSLYFWPMAVNQPVNENEMRYSWPDYKVLLHSQSKTKKYIPAAVTDSFARYFNSLFKPEIGSPIQLMRNQELKYWGLAIIGGEVRRDSNMQLVEPMLKYFTRCLGTLNEEELGAIKPGIYAPETFYNKSGKLKFDMELADAASKLDHNFRTNLCTENKSKIPKLLISRSRFLLQAMITGKSSEIIMVDSAVAAFTTIFHELLFSSEGLWMKVSSQEIQDFVIRRLENFHELKELSWIAQDYHSFLDFVILTRKNNLLSKNQYMIIAELLGINQANELFVNFPLNQLFKANKISALNLHIGSKISTLFLPGVNNE